MAAGQAPCDGASGLTDGFVPHLEVASSCQACTAVSTTAEMHALLTKARTTVAPAARWVWAQTNLLRRKFVHPQGLVLELQMTSLKRLMHSHFSIRVHSDIRPSAKYSVRGEASVPDPQCAICKTATACIANSPNGTRYNFCPFCGPAEHCVQNMFYFCNHQPLARANAEFGAGQHGVRCFSPPAGDRRLLPACCGIGCAHTYLRCMHAYVLTPICHHLLLFFSDACMQEFRLKFRKTDMRGNNELFLCYRDPRMKEVETTTSNRWCCAHLPQPKLCRAKVKHLHMCASCFMRLKRTIAKTGGGRCPFCLRGQIGNGQVVCSTCRKRFCTIAK